MITFANVLNLLSPMRTVATGYELQICGDVTYKASAVALPVVHTQKICSGAVVLALFPTIRAWKANGGGTALRSAIARRYEFPHRGV